MKHWLIGLQGGWMALFLWATPLSADQHTLLDGHILEEINLSSEEDRTLLTLRGIFSLRLLPEMELIAEEDAQRWIIALPKALVNNLTLADGISFPPLSALNNIEVDEEIQAVGDGLQFQSNLYLTAPQPVSLLLLEDETNSEQLTFLVFPAGPATELVVEEVEAIEPPPFKQLPLLSERPNVRGSESSGFDPLLLHPVSAMLLFQRPLTFHLSILNASPNQEAAQQLAILLDRHFRRFLESQLDMRMNITNISSVQEQTTFSKTTIYFRPNFMKAALALAMVMPGEQVVERMSVEQRARLGLDIEIYAGANVE